MSPLLVHAVRRVVRRLPRPIRNIAKKNPKLLAFNRYLVRQPQLTARGYFSQLIYGARPAHRLGQIIKSPLYEKNIKATNCFLKVLPAPQSESFQVAIIGDYFCSEAFKDTWKSIVAMGQDVGSVVFVTTTELRDEYEQAIEQLSKVPANINLTLLAGEEVREFQWHKPAFVTFISDQLNSALARAIKHYINDEQIKLAYVDIDRIDHKGARGAPEFYPDWNPDLQITTGYIHGGIWLREPSVLFAAETFSVHKGVVATWLIHQALDGQLREHEIVHIPIALVHKGLQRDKVFHYADADLLQKISALADWRFTLSNQVLALTWKRPNDPLVSIIIPTKNGKQLVESCVESILHRTAYPHYEILLIDNNSDEEESLEYFEELATAGKVRLLKYPHPFNYSAINNFAVEQAQGEYIALVNNDIEFISSDWLDLMLGHAMRDDVGCVGAKLLYGNHTLQHAGVVMGYGGGAGHAHKHLPEQAPGYLNRAIATNNFSAVTAACLMVSKADFNAVGGLNDTDLTIAFNDVDFCLRVRELGRRNVYCAESVMYHHESVSRGFDEEGEAAQRFKGEVKYLQSRWRELIKHDPAYNPNLTLNAEHFGVVGDPRLYTHD